MFQKIKIGSFLTERKDRMTPQEANGSGLARIQKINFSGEFFISEEKSTNTGMIVIQPNNLVISGINVAKGCIGIYRGTEKVLATIHYSSYQYDVSKINIDYLKRFVRSKAFQNTILEQTKGGIKTEIKAKTFLNLEIDLPSLNEQKIIIEKIEEFKSEEGLYTEKIVESTYLIKSLRQSILSDAIAGKLVPQDPSDEPASELLKKIQTEKEKLIADGKLKKQKSLAPITEVEKPFELPGGWEWVKLGDIIFKSENLNIHTKLPGNTLINYIDIDAIDNCKHAIKEPKLTKVNELSSRARRVLKHGYILYSTVRPYLDNIAFINCELENMIGSTGFVVFKPILVDPKYIFNFLLSSYVKEYYLSFLKGFNSPSITDDQFGSVLVPLPPLAEQHGIVAKVDELMTLCDELEKRIIDTRDQGKLLMENVLSEVIG